MKFYIFYLLGLVISDAPNPFLGLGPNMASYAMGDPKYNYAPLS